MRTCKEYEVLVSAFLDGELSEADRAEIAGHLASCPDCQQYFDDLVAMHDAFTQAEEIPVPEGFAAQVMARVHETPQPEVQRVVSFPHWKRWAALAACCAIAALGLWSFQSRGGGAQEAKQAMMARSAPSTAQDAAPPSPSEAADSDDGAIMAMMDEGAALPEEAPAYGDGFSEAQKQSPDGGYAGSLPEAQDDAIKTEADAGDYDRAAPVPEPAMLSPAAPAGEDLAASCSGVIISSGEAARAWVENELGLEWEPGRAYLLTGEEYAGLLDALAEAGEDFRIEPGEGCWLLAEQEPAS